MTAISESKTVWARQVARALEKKLDASETYFYWAKAGEDILLKEPTCKWPREPRLVYQVEEGGNEGVFVEVLHRTDEGKTEQLLVCKFLTSIKAAGPCVDAVAGFLEAFHPEQLHAA